jgi:prepilin-type N-terminal cleavage/methylation domain-containing protein
MQGRTIVNQRGFTLIETAVVLVIIGLILGGILGSRSLIRSMQAKDVIAIVEDLRAATTYFKQRHSYLPGDWPYTAGEIPHITGSPGDGDGAIEGTITAGVAQANSEVLAAPLHLFHDGFIGKLDNSDTDLSISSLATLRLKTNYGAVHMVTPANSGVAPAYATENPTVRNVIVFINLPCDIAMEVDSKIDNGDINNGRALGTACTNDVVDRYAVALE